MCTLCVIKFKLKESKLFVCYLQSGQKTTRIPVNFLISKLTDFKIFENFKRNGKIEEKIWQRFFQIGIFLAVIGNLQAFPKKS